MCSVCCRKEDDMDREITMREIFARLTKELGYEKGKSTFEWYCTTYGVTIADNAPASVRREVLGK